MYIYICVYIYIYTETNGSLVEIAVSVWVNFQPCLVSDARDFGCQL